MPTSDLDMPLLPSAEQIRRREFATVRRGYDPQQVRAYLTSIANQVGTLERELSQLRLESGAAAARSEAPMAPPPSEPSTTQDPYDALSKRFAKLIEMADQEAARILEDARTEARLAVDDARGEADRIKVDAQANAEAARQEAAELLERTKAESDRVLSSLGERRRTMVSELEEMRTTLLAVAADLAGPIEVATRADAEDAAATDTSEPPHDPNGAPERAQTATDGTTPVDPRYEDLWVSTDSIELPDLASIDLDFDERDE